MTTKLKTLSDISNQVKAFVDLNAEWESKMTQLTGMEAKLRELQDREGKVRTELQHIEIQRIRLLRTMGPCA